MVLCASIVLSGCAATLDLRPIGAPEPSLTLIEGKQLLGQGRAAEAVTAFRKHLRQEGDSLHGLNGLAIAYSELGRPDLAAEMFSRALTIAPDDPATLNNIGFSALRRADAGLARRYLEKASLQQGDHQEIQGNLAGLAFLEQIKQKPGSAPALTRAALYTRDQRPSPVTRLALPRSGGHTASLIAALEAAASKPSPQPSKVTLVDFTSVIDPFSSQ